MTSNKNPIYIEYYPHTKCDCYKIDLPWSKYKQHVMVLCAVDEGYPKAVELALREITKHFEEAVSDNIPTEAI
jgi:hypothetical protein